MAVYEHGTAINDQTGVININVGTGQAFYNDGTGTIVNLWYNLHFRRVPIGE